MVRILYVLKERLERKFFFFFWGSKVDNLVERWEKAPFPHLARIRKACGEDYANCRVSIRSIVLVYFFRLLDGNSLNARQIRLAASPPTRRRNGRQIRDSPAAFTSGKLLSEWTSTRQVHKKLFVFLIRRVQKFGETRRRIYRLYCGIVYCSTLNIWSLGASYFYVLFIRDNGRYSYCPLRDRNR